MICLICRQAKVAYGRTTVKFERGEMQLIVNDVPARICPGCGEAYVNEEVAVQLLREAAKTFQAGILDRVWDYKSIPS